MTWKDAMQGEIGLWFALALVPVVLLCLSCTAGSRDPVDPGKAEADEWAPRRAAMVAHLRSEYGVSDERVLTAMSTVRRHMYIPKAYRKANLAYGDHPCPIGHNQTISQPFIVATMTERLGLKKGQKVLEIGTGSGYQAAVLSELGADVYSIEIVPELAAHARRVLRSEGYADVKVLTGDGYKGWPKHSPFDAIIVTAAPEKVPQPLVDQLKDGGTMILPVGDTFQELVLVRKSGDRIEKKRVFGVRFVPMVHGDD